MDMRWIRKFRYRKTINSMKKFFVAAMILAAGTAVHAQKYGNTPEDSLTCLQNLSVYQEFYKQKNYYDAYDAWKKVLEVCPATSLNTYIRGSVILKTRIAREKDATARAQYIDELLALWDTRTQYYGRPGYCTGMKARDMRTYMPGKVKEAYELYEKAMEYSSEAGFINIPYFYFEGARDAFKAGIIDKVGLINAYEKAIAALEGMSKANPSDTLPAAMEAAVNSLFEPYAACEDLIPLYTERFKTSSQDADFLRKATRMLGSRSCTDSEIFFQMAEALYKLEPSPESAYQMARMNYARGAYAEAIGYLTEENLAQLPETDKENAYLLIGDASMKLGRYSAARSACNRVHELNPGNGRAYILLGSVYAAGADACSDGTPIGQRAPYWAAVDMFYKAKSVEPDLAETVDKLIATYSAHFPSSDDLFTYGFKEGDSYTISCWFTHTTTIRARR